jgi:hypothetical protein
MKQNPKRQLIELLEGLGMDPWEAMKQPASYSRIVGENFMHLAQIGNDYADKLMAEAKQKENKCLPDQ